MTDPRPTLLVFTLGPTGESARRRLLPGPLRALESGLHRACLEAAMAAGREGGMAVEVSSPATLALPAGVRQAHQGGGSFGQRLAAAVAGAFRRGAGPVVVVGSDAPGLSAAHLHQALGRLAGDPRRVVVGPSPDGGLYLLAAAAPLDGVLAGVPWCRRDTLARLEEALTRAGFEVERLAPLADLDRPADLERWLASRRDALPRWRDLLKRLLAAWRRPPVLRRLGRPALAPVPVRGGRAPPPPRLR